MRALTRPLAAAATAALLLPAAAWAQSDSPAEPVIATVDAELGFAGWVDPDQPAVIVAEVAADQLIVGQLTARFSGTVTSVDVEIPAGGIKRYTLDLPPLADARSVSLSLDRIDADGNRERVVAESLRANVPTDLVLVGLAGLDGLESTIRASKSTPLGRDLEPLTVEAVDLASGGGALAYLVVGQGGLGDVGGDTVRNLEQWIKRGGRLYGPASVVDLFAVPGSGSVLPGLPVTATRVGSGEVGVLDAPRELSAGQWDALIRDVPPKGLITDYSKQDLPFSLLSATTAGRDASVPALPWLLAGILLFVVLVGPANFVVLRSLRKPELAWATVPALSFVFVAGFWFLGRSQVEEFTVGHASIIVDEAGSTTGAAGLVLQAETAGDHLLSLPAGWGATSFPGGGVASPTAVNRVGETTVARFDLQDLGVGAAQTSWSDAPVDVGVAVSAADRAFTFTVDNRTGWSFWSWGVVVGGRGFASQTPLDAGAEGTLDASIPRGISNVYDPVIAEAVLRRGFKIDGAGSEVGYETIYGLGRYAEELATGLRSNRAYFFGFTDDLVHDVTVDGRGAAADGRSLIVKEISLTAGQSLALGRSRPELLAISGAATVEGYYNEIYAYGARDIVFRYLVPEGAPPTARVSPGFTQLSIVQAWDWQAGEYRDIEWNAAFDLSWAASATGEVLVQASIDGEGRFFDESIQLDRFALDWSTS